MSFYFGLRLCFHINNMISIYCLFIFKKLFRKSLRYFLCIILFLCTFVLFLNFSVNSKKYPVIVWWTSSFIAYDSKISKCYNEINCEFINITNADKLKNAKGFLFYGSSFDKYNLPLPKRDDVLWGLLHEESPRNNLVLLHEPTLKLFNYSSTISRYSNVPLTLQYLESVQEILTKDYFIDTRSKNNMLKDISPVLFIQSDCDTSSYRDDYVKELIKYISVDSYGECLNNKKLDYIYKDDYLNRLNDDQFLKFVSRYKFTISIENGICNDYITEKLWRPLKVGSVPIYLGSPTVQDWLPNNRSVILINNFKSVKQLADYLLYLNNNDDEYEKYLEHKLIGKISNQRLINEIESKISYSNSDYGMPLIENFECFLCAKVHQIINFNVHSVINQSHYDCLKPVSPWKGLEPSFWLKLWEESIKESYLLNKFVLIDKKYNFTKEEFEHQLLLL